MQPYLPTAVANGVFMSGRGMSGEVDGIVAVVFAALCGALAGFIAGMLSGTLTRIFTLNRDKGVIGGIHWGAYGAAAGALLLAAVQFFG